MPVTSYLNLEQKSTRQVLFSLSRLVERQGGGCDTSSMVAGSLPKCTLLYPHIWVNYNDLTATSLEQWLGRGKLS